MCISCHHFSKVFRRICYTHMYDIDICLHSMIDYLIVLAYRDIFQVVDTRLRPFIKRFHWEQINQLSGQELNT